MVRSIRFCLSLLIFGTVIGGVIGWDGLLSRSYGEKDRTTFARDQHRLSVLADEPVVLFRPAARAFKSSVEPSTMRPMAAPLAPLFVNPDGVCGGNAPCFMTIQAAINAAAPGDTINVAAATYAEQININKALTLMGPNANIDPNTGARVAEAIIIPTSSDPVNPAFGGPIVVYASVSGVTFKGFTVDGNNPGLTSGVVFNGSDVDAEFGIYGDGSANPDLVIQNNIVKNIGEMAVWSNTFGFGGARNANSRITNNKVDNDLGNFGQGIRISDDAWLDIKDNVVTRVRNGIVIENMSGNVTTHPASVISNNNVTSFRIGIRHNLHYVYSAPGFTISNNIVQPYVQTPLPPQVSAATAYQGIRVESIQQTVAVTVTGNYLVGNKTAMIGGGYTRNEGLNVTNASATSPNILFNLNAVSDFVRGVFHETPAIPTFDCNSFTGNTTGVLLDAAATNGLIAHNNSIAGNGFGLQNNGPATVDAKTNWWGAANGPGPVGPGSGDNVSTRVDFANWLVAVPGCFVNPLAPDLRVAKTHSGNFTQCETGKSYVLTVTNQGGTASSGLVTLTDNLPAGLTATSWGGAGWNNCTATPVTGPAVLSCNRSDALNPGGPGYPVVNLTVSVSCAAPANVTNSATVSGGGDGSPGNNTANDPTTIAPENIPPSIVCPGSITRFTDSGQQSAIVNPGTPVATDNSGVVSVTGVRSDGKPLNAPYPVGITLITWTAKDGANNKASCGQSITVMVPSGPRRIPSTAPEEALMILTDVISGLVAAAW